MKKKTVSVIIPAFNEEDCIEELAKRLKTVFRKEKNYAFEVLLVENGSTDGTWVKCKELNRKDRRFKIIKLSRNFRMDGAITAGLEYVESDCCVIMAADLQDPPEVISLFLREWELGWENIFGVISKRIGTGTVRNFNSKMFYRVANYMSGGKIPLNASDFRLVDKKVYISVREMREKNRFVRGLFAWSGFRSKGILIERPPRFGGKSNAHTSAVIDLALKGIFAHTYKPLKLITLIGLALSAASLFLLIALIVTWIKLGVPFAGYGSLMATLLLFISFLFLLLGVIGEYIGLIYEEVKNRPNFLISERVGFHKLF